MAKSEMITEKSIPMPITQRAIQTARQFAHQQPNPQEAEQVYLNTLAVLAVHDYLELMEIDTDLRQSDSWHPLLRMCVDVADLKVKGLGKLECRPVKVSRQGVLHEDWGHRGTDKNDSLPSQPITSDRESSEQSMTLICLIPPEVWNERIGYVVVGIDEERKEATLLGFTETVGTGELRLSQLHSMDALLEHLEQLARSQVNLSQWLQNIFEAPWQDVNSLFGTEQETLVSDKSSTSVLNLNKWFQNIFDTSWQAIADLFDRNNSEVQLQGSLSFRNSESVVSQKGKMEFLSFPNADVTRAKLIDLGMQVGTKTFALLVALTQESDQKVNIIVQVHPAVGQRYLPSQLKLALLAESGETLQEVESRGQDLYIQLRPFKVLPGNRFNIQVVLDDANITEAFAI